MQFIIHKNTGDEIRRRCKTFRAQWEPVQVFPTPRLLAVLITLRVVHHRDGHVRVCRASDAFSHAAPPASAGTYRTAQG